MNHESATVHYDQSLADDLRPLRGDTFSAEHLEQMFREIALNMTVARESWQRDYSSHQKSFSARLERQSREIAQSHAIVSQTAARGETVPAEAEWLLDNYYVVEEQLREIRDDLPRGYYRELPKADSGYPRVYEIARKLVIHTDSSFDAALIQRCVDSFQSAAVLEIGEVWAVPIMLRLVLVENLHRLCKQMLLTHHCRVSALKLIEESATRAPWEIELCDDPACLPTVVQLLEQLPDLSADHQQITQRLEQRITDHGWDPTEVVRQEHQRQAANQVSIGNVITSMRLIAALDWVSFFEQVNRAEAVLRQDPAGVYATMHFESRDHYRHELEHLARSTRASDVQVATLVIGLSQQAANSVPDDPRQQHVGYWLVDDGRRQLEAKLNYRAPMSRLLRVWLRRYPHLAYFGSLFLLLLAALGLLGSITSTSTNSLLLVVGLLLIWLVPMSEFVLGLINFAITHMLPPELLPRLDFKSGIPTEYPTVVVVPSLLTNSSEVETLLQRLENHYLANPDRALSFALLTDFTDADFESLSEDKTLIEQARSGIQLLNQRYGNSTCQPFYLFHRARRWNEAEGKWMGWERKRGKLMEFGRWLQGHADTSFTVTVGDLKSLACLRRPDATPFIITLDADTQLPFESARKLVGTLAHPLNRPRFAPSSTAGISKANEAKGRGTKDDRVVRGYTVLQPRVSVQLESASNSYYANLFSGSPGVDPYVTAASDVYQDLFGEGSFTGKGIYDLHAFERSLGRAFPENSILSHDLIEGCHARVGLVSNIEVFDAFPSRYDADMRRHHRWVRGDWQLLPWLLPRVPYADGWRENPLSWLSWWKVFDNLRRSLVAPTLITATITGWYVMPSMSWLWSLLALAVVFLPTITTLFSGLNGWNSRIPLWEHLTSVLRDLGRSILQGAFNLATLPHKALVMADAITRTIWRILISRKRMLQWQTASAVESQLRQPGTRALWQYWYLPLLALGLTLTLPLQSQLWAWPLELLWFLAPLLISFSNRALTSKQSPLTESQLLELRTHASQTWSFFEAYVGPNDNWLPVDNVQEEPQEKIAQRLSPTNEGLYLLSALAAHDFGFLGLQQLVDLWTNNLDSIERLERLHGHLYNWYDTQSLQPLAPRYVSTVDSGNLLACLLTVKQGIAELPTVSADPQRFVSGVVHALDILDQATTELTAEDPAEVTNFVVQLRERLADVRRHMNSMATGNTVDWQQWFQLQKHVQPLMDLLSIGTSWKLNRRHADRLRRMASKVAIASRRIEGLLTESATLHGWLPPLLKRCASAQLSEPLKRLTKLEYLSGMPEDARAACAYLCQELPVGFDDHDVEQWGNLLVSAGRSARGLVKKLGRLAERFEAFALSMDFRFLYNPQRKLFSIGFNVEEGALDRSHYDMLCSESRLSSYLAIAKGDVESLHWFRLGRHSTLVRGQFALLSWGGTMFEYLMPALFQSQYEGSMLTQSCRAAVQRQIDFGRQHRVPWGISESAFGALAANADYHYRSFGVPGLGLKRGLAKDLVISPYSTFIALVVDPSNAVTNLEVIAQEGGLGHYGYYEALDYTAERVPANKRRLIVRCYMAHHHGMSLLALANVLNNQCIQRRFSSHPLPRAAELLLQERVPQAVVPFEPHADESQLVQHASEAMTLTSRRLLGVESPCPRTHLLSNGTYSVMLSGAGGGYSRVGQNAVTRWRSDTTLDQWGQFLYIRDMDSGQFWSATYQPTRVVPDFYEVLFAIDKVDFHRRQGAIESLLEIAISPENNAEVRQLRLTNHGTESRRLELTSYAEVCLAKPAADIAHPAFQKLFIETEYIAEEMALIARRRPRDQSVPAEFAVHVLATPAEGVSDVQFETSRHEFLGRRRGTEHPQAMFTQQLEARSGAVLDPVFSLRCVVEVPAGGSISVAWTTGVADSRDEALALADQYHELRNVHRVFELTWAYAQVELRHQHLSPEQVHLYQRLAAYLLYPHWSMRGDAHLISQNSLGQSALWRHGISGDLPILLVRITEPEQISIVRELSMAHRFWRQRGFLVDLVIVNDYPGSYYDAVQDQITGVLRDLHHAPEFPGVYILRGSQLAPEEVALLHSVASCFLNADFGNVVQQLDAAQLRAQARAGELAALRTQDFQAAVDSPAVDHSFDPHVLEFYNGYGGFQNDGREYRIQASGERLPPAPWSHVVANPRVGFLVTESGGGYSWFENSRENKLAPWSNDPVTDPPSELLYVHEESTGRVFLPMTLDPSDSSQPALQTTYGAGFARFDRHWPSLHTSVQLAVAAEHPVKMVRLMVTNNGSADRTFVATYFAEIVLGVSRDSSAWHVQSELDESRQALLFRNPYHPEYARQVVFAKVLDKLHGYTADRMEFLGRMGSYLNPVGLQAERLTGRTSIETDPCAAIQTKFVLRAGETREVCFIFGAGLDRQEALELLDKYTSPHEIQHTVSESLDAWQRTLSTIRVRTPNRALDILVNNWLIYQVLCCRLWARSAFYQSGGAFGFRDQLQDSMAVVYSRPDITRQQILLSASRQFKQGDVQHWWHPPLGKGTRTRFSDDLLWLPLVTAHYIDVTGDANILDEVIPYLESPELQPHEMERYELPRVSGDKGSLLEHCLKAIDRGTQFGQHGLPLMGCGDWNDGMNKVGEGGQGESVWVGWFLLVILKRFCPLLHEHGMPEQAHRLEAVAEKLRSSLEQHAWDGQWYRRAFYDDGSPMGSKSNDECQIDSLTQTWAVFAQADSTRVQQAMAWAVTRLVDSDRQMIRLFTPPFDRGTHDPGYIKGYLPGIRENGGQYTHAATWMVQALSQLGQAQAAMNLWDMINPINHTLTPRDVDIYKTEPYAVAADVYSAPTHEGRGGWTWYTGSAAWLYRVAIEQLLGLHVHHGQATIRPALPEDWEEFQVWYRDQPTASMPPKTVASEKS